MYRTQHDHATAETAADKAARTAARPEPVKRHRGELGHTRDTRAHTGTRITQTDLTAIQTQRHPRTTTRRPKPRPAQHPQARSRPLPAADSEEAAPSEPERTRPCLHPPAPRAPLASRPVRRENGHVVKSWQCRSPLSRPSNTGAIPVLLVTNIRVLFECQKCVLSPELQECMDPNEGSAATSAHG